MTESGLSPKQQRFVVEYLVDLNATQAAIRAGYSAKTAEQQGSRLLSNVKVWAAIQVALDARAARVEITADMVLQRWWQIATTDVNELVQVHRYGCRHCHGVDHQYQWVDQDEYEGALARAMEAESALPDNDGGYGYDPSAPPVTGCPRCRGLGMAMVHVHDTRRLSPAATILYAGAKETKDGIEIKLQDQGKALENVARHLGMFKERVEVEVTNLADVIAARRKRAANRDG